MGYTLRAVVVHGLELLALVVAVTIAVQGTRAASQARLLALAGLSCFGLTALTNLGLTLMSAKGFEAIDASDDVIRTVYAWIGLPLTVIFAVGMVLIAFAVGADRAPVPGPVPTPSMRGDVPGQE